MPTSSGPKSSECVRTTLVRLTESRMSLTVVLLNTIESPIARECCVLSRPPSVAARMFPFAFSNAGSQNVVDSMYRANNVWLVLSRQSIRAIGWLSRGLVGREYEIWPHGSLVVGSIFAIFTAAG